MPGLVATPDGGGLARWNLEMQPYELVVVWFGAPNVQVVDWQATMPAAVVAAVQQQLTSVRDRAQQLQRPHPLQTLVNGDFEAVSNDLAQPIQGWTVTANGGSAQLDRQIRKNGTQSLRLSAPDNGQVRVVSTPIPVPATGKLYVFVWMRVADQKQQPRLRVMVRGDDGYFSYLHVGAKQQFQLSSDWGEGFLFPFAQIPSTVKNLTLEFTLMGGADVWIDGVSPFDYWFARSERNKLITDIGRLGFDLQRRGSVSDSLRFLDSYWSEFLIEHVPAAPVAAVANVPPAAKEEKPAATARNPVNRIRDLVPPLKFPRMKR